MQDDVNLHAEFSQGALADGLDTAYWESVFPGYSSTDWSWLDPAPMPPVLPLPSQAGMADGVGEMVGP